MKVRDIDFSAYPDCAVFVLMPQNFQSGLGANFPAGSGDAVVRLFGEIGLADPEPLYDPEKKRVTVRLSENVDVYKRK